VARRILAFLAAVLVMSILGATLHSLFAQDAWSAAAGQDGAHPAALSLTDRLTWIGRDIVGMTDISGVIFPSPGNMSLPYSVVVAIALLVGFLAAGLASRILGLRTLAFAIAGALAIFAALSAIKLIAGTIGIFGARTMLGMAAQMAAGAVSGYVFATMTRPR
jgi:hypothetical protein